MTAEPNTIMTTDQALATLERCVNTGRWSAFGEDNVVEQPEYRAALSVLTQEIERLQEALEPFARDVEAFDGAEHTYGDRAVFERLSGEHHWSFTIADARRAHAALAEHKDIP